MSRFLLALLLTLSLASCSSSTKKGEVDDPWAQQERSNQQDPPSAADDDDSGQPADDDDSGQPADDDDSAAPEPTPPSPAIETATGADGAPLAVPPPDFIPPPPGKKGVLERAAALMMGTRFRWIQGSKDVAYGLYGAPVMLNLWSCSDKKIDENLEWMTLMEKTYSNQMLSILVPANVAERSLTGQDNICGRSVRFGRSVGIDVGKGVMSELSVKKLPTNLVFNSQGVEVARHEGPMSKGSSAAKELEAALKQEMAPVTEGRTLAP